ncbi:MAG: DUF370 domain-containing protein [Chloroflexi bacterium]|nr:DUF370 domain-containing protein [Chloroflexota bacterium]
MGIQLVNIGFGNVLAMNRVVAILPPHSLPVKRMLKELKEANLMIDMTSGRKVKSVLFTDDGRVILAALTPLTIAGRVQTQEEERARGEGAK